MVASWLKRKRGVCCKRSGEFGHGTGAAGRTLVCGRLNLMGMPVSRHSIWTRYGFFWVTGAFFIISLTGHWVFAWFAYVQEQFAHQQPVQVSEFLIQVSRDTLENWQSEFLQLI